MSLGTFLLVVILNGIPHQEVYYTQNTCFSVEKTYRSAHAEISVSCRRINPPAVKQH